MISAGSLSSSANQRYGPVLVINLLVSSLSRSNLHRDLGESGPARARDSEPDDDEADSCAFLLLIYVYYGRCHVATLIILHLIFTAVKCIDYLLMRMIWCVRERTTHPKEVLVSYSLVLKIAIKIILGNHTTVL